MAFYKHDQKAVRNKTRTAFFVAPKGLPSRSAILCILCILYQFVRFVHFHTFRAFWGSNGRSCQIFFLWLVDV